MTTNKYGIVMLCMLTDHYVLGALIAAYAHKQFIKLNDLGIDLIVMCDEYLYNKYKDSLKIQFDKVVKIDLLYYKHAFDYNQSTSKKYSSWIGYSINKWQCLNFDDYKKILFVDTDIMPVDIKFYNIFEFNTPAFHMHYGIHEKMLKKDDCINGSSVNNPLKNAESYSDYISNFNISLDGGCVLLKPDKNIYQKYINYLNNIFSNGMKFMDGSGGDETSLFYFYTKYLPERVFYKICNNYAVIPWENILKIKEPYGYNFLSYVKPWLKPKFIIWKEERIWRNLYDRMEKNNEIKELFKNTLMKGYNDFLNTDDYHKKRYYYMGYIQKHKELYHIKNFDELISYEKKVYFPKGDYGSLNIKRN